MVVSADSSKPLVFPFILISKELTPEASALFMFLFLSYSMASNIQLPYPHLRREAALLTSKKPAYKSPKSASGLGVTTR